MTRLAGLIEFPVIWGIGYDSGITRANVLKFHTAVIQFHYFERLLGLVILGITEVSFKSK